VKSIDEKKVQVFTNYELSYLLPKPPLPPPPTDPIEVVLKINY
jgi:U2-associated protein SR140